MANKITLAKSFIPTLDLVYKKASISTALNSNSTLAREAANVNEIEIPKISMDGLADYDRNAGYVGGSVTLDWETVKFNYDRGRMFEVDAMDNQESVNLAFGRLASEFVRTKVAPEADAFTFATLAQQANILGAEGALGTGAATVEALSAAQNAMDEEEVDDGRILFIVPDLLRAVNDMDTTKSRAVLSEFSQIIAVPKKRFYSKITLNDGKTSGQEAGHFAKASDGSQINFMIVEPSAVIKFDKHVAQNPIAPEDNQHADAWMLKYRKYGLVTSYENKRSGIYVQKEAAAAAAKKNN